MATEPARVTYETFTSSEAQSASFRAAVQTVGDGLGREHPFYVGGERCWGEGWLPERSPADLRTVVGRFAAATRDDLDRAIELAGSALGEWSQTGWPERVSIVSRVSAAVSERRYELAAILAHEAGKPLLEALGEVDECAVLIDYYCEQMIAADGFVTRMYPPDGVASGTRERALSVLRPYGVWAVIGPFNFPMALLLGPIAAALIAGNTVVAKPSPHGYLSGLAVYDMFVQAGVPADVLHLLSIPEERLGEHLYTHPGLGGLTFTGSRATGMEIFHGFNRDRPRPAICEMGGKNPAIVTATADLEKAARGIVRSAFGFSGQRCSGCSRVLVARTVHDELVELLERRRLEVKPGSPLDPDTLVGPVISPDSLQRLSSALEHCREQGWRVRGGARLLEGGLEHGNYAEPALAEIPRDSSLLREELFTPFVAVHAVDSLSQALAVANSLPYGLTAGVYATEQSEIERFVEEIDAAVVYVNREAGATTGAWPGIQPFGGWKSSGSTGRGAGGVHYLQQYMREQSRTFVED